MALDHAAHAIGDRRVRRKSRDESGAVVPAEQEEPDVAERAAERADGDDDRGSDR